MRKTKIVQIAVEQEQIEEIKCNVCGENKVRPAKSLGEMNDFHEMKINGAYACTYPEDLVTVRFDVCGPCLLAWVNTFKHAPDEEHWL